MVLWAITTHADPSFTASRPAEDPEYPAWFAREQPRFNAIALVANPLGIVIGRFSADLDYLPMVHHAIHGSAHYDFAFLGNDAHLYGGGIEVGYRYYTGTGGAEGWFLGGSLLYGKSHYVHRGSPSCKSTSPVACDLAGDQAWQAFGVALDGGYQVLVDRVVIGVGMGVQAVYYDESPVFEADTRDRSVLLYGAGFRPRALLSLGGTF